MPPDEEDLHGRSYGLDHHHPVFPHGEEMNDGVSLIDPLRRPTKTPKFGLRARSYHRHILSDPSKLWHRRVRMAASFGNILRMLLLLLLLIAIAVACFTLPIDRVTFSSLPVFLSTIELYETFDLLLEASIYEIRHQMQRRH